LLDFFLTANTEANKILNNLEQENGDIDFYEAQKRWEKKFLELVKEKI
jgi:hypothetical protein